MSERARAVLRDCECVVGYTVYIELLQEFIQGKEIIYTGMRREAERCRRALALAAAGKTVCLISGGDPGVYGMAGLVLELREKMPAAARPPVEIIPGISALNMAAAILGAPLTHDFAVISLSDLLTPWEKIRKRIEAAALGDFVTVVYNPRSNKRVEQLTRLQEIMLVHRAPATPVGIVENAARAGERRIISTLASFTAEKITMFSIVIIGNSATYSRDGLMITPRGYPL
jgi:precorrin-3B C17-methyltransferase